MVWLAKFNQPPASPWLEEKGGVGAGAKIGGRKKIAAAFAVIYQFDPEAGCFRSHLNRSSS